MWIFIITSEENDNKSETDKKKERKNVENAEVSFYLKSGVILCRLANKIIPDCNIDIESLEVTLRMENVI